MGEEDGTECLAVLFITKLRRRSKREWLFSTSAPPHPHLVCPCVPGLSGLSTLSRNAGGSVEPTQLCGDVPHPCSSQQGRDEEVEFRGDRWGPEQTQASRSIWSSEISAGPVWLQGGPRREGPAG